MLTKFDLKEESKTMLMVGLGNIGKEYENTRHNAGFMFLDRFIKEVTVRGYEHLAKEHRHYYSYFFPELDLFIIKPKTLMNLSGLAVKRFLNYSRNIEGMIVVHDDLDLEIGQYKFQYGKGPRSHNGINSIVESLQSTNFYRIRIGIDNRKGIPIPGLDYVLYELPKDEMEQLEILFGMIIDRHFII